MPGWKLGRQNVLCCKGKANPGSEQRINDEVEKGGSSNINQCDGNLYDYNETTLTNWTYQIPALCRPSIA